jgi:hypothetical protein
MLKIVLIPFFLLLNVSSIFAAIEVRDTTPLEQQCDTIIEKNGLSSPVRILSISQLSITYQQCSNSAKKKYTIAVSKVQDIKSQTFKFEKPKSVPLLKRAKNALKLAAISVSLFVMSILAVAPSFEGDSGDDSKWLIIPFIILLISPFVIVGSFFNSMIILTKAQKAKDKKAAAKATGGLILSLIPLLILLLLFL